LGGVDELLIVVIPFVTLLFAARIVWGGDVGEGLLVGGSNCS
jgi:hypothetical protein